jgi:hypothetical protein
MAYIGNPIISTDFPKNTFSGNGSTTAFTMSIAPASVNAVIVIVSGVVQEPSTYTISGATLTFSGAPPIGTNNISVRHLGVAGTPNVPALASVGIAQHNATGTPSSSTFLRGDNSWVSVSSFDSGTAILFAQTSAPTGWTKSTTHNNKALRVVSGTAGSGGSVGFTTAFASQAVSGTVNATTLSISQIPAHGHDVYANSFAGNLRIAMGPLGGDGSLYSVSDSGNDASNTGAVFYAANNGGGGSHSHSFSGTAIDLAVQYVDVIIATKD